MAKKIQPSFAKGEVGPSMYARVDTAAYQVGLRTAFNGFIKATGGFDNRPGTIYLGCLMEKNYGIILKNINQIFYHLHLRTHHLK